MSLISRRTVGAALVGTLAIAGLAACGGDDGPSITVYSGRSEDLVGPVVERFEKETGINVDVKYGQSADLALLLDEEAAADRTEVDVFISQSPGALGYLDANGRIGVLPDPVLDLVPATVRAADGRWVGVTGRQRVLVYNTDLVDEADLPTSVLDLADPAWKGRVGIAPENGSFQDFVTAMRVSQGDDATAEWLAALAANDPVIYANNNAIVEAAARGEIEVGLVNHYYNHRRLVEVPDSPTANHYFADGDPGSVLIITGAAIVEGTDRSEDALRFIEFLLESESQAYFAEETFEYPLATGSEPAGDVPVVEFADVSGIDFEALAGGLSATRDMITAAGLLG